MARYYEAGRDVYQLVDDMIDDRFSNLASVKIKVLMNSKSKIDKLKDIVTFASIKLTSEVEKFLSKDGHNLEGFDYLMFVDELVWELADVKSRKRIISHELRHCFIDDKGSYKVIRHDIEDFHEEIKFNEDDPMWGQALSTIAMAKYRQLREEEKANK